MNKLTSWVRKARTVSLVFIQRVRKIITFENIGSLILALVACMIICLLVAYIYQGIRGEVLCGSRGFPDSDWVSFGHVVCHRLENGNDVTRPLDWVLKYCNEFGECSE